MATYACIAGFRRSIASTRLSRRRRPSSAAQLSIEGLADRRCRSAVRGDAADRLVPAWPRWSHPLHRRPERGHRTETRRRQGRALARSRGRARAMEARRIVAAANVGGLAAKNATSTIPIVVVSSHDGVRGRALRQPRPSRRQRDRNRMSRARPRSQTLEFLKQALPKLSRIAVRYNRRSGRPVMSRSPVDRTIARLADAPGRGRSAAEFDAAFADITRDRPDALRS